MTAVPARTPDDPPNVVLVYTDDQDQSRLGCYGGDVPTPNVDRLADEGVRFDRFYVSSPVCTPSRYSALTGRYASRSRQLRERAGDPANVGFDAGLHAAESNLARVLSDHGYATGMVGKWHLGVEGDTEAVPPDADGRDPAVARALEENYERAVEAAEARGFDEARSVYESNPAGIELPESMRHHNMDWVTRGALDFLDAHHGEPFFLYLAPTLTHGPWGLEQLATDPTSTPAGYLDEPPDVQPSREAVRERLRERGLIRGRRGHGFEVGAAAAWLDDGVGAVLDRLDELGVAEDTLVLFASDNGDVTGKGTCYEAGARMPCIARWPARVDPGEPRAELVSNVDLAATVFDATGVDPGDDYRLDGRSFLPLLTGGGGYERESLYLEVARSRAVVTEHRKYLAVRHPEEVERDVEAGARYSHAGDRLEYDHAGWYADVDYPHYFDRDQLYDLEADPGEQRNVAGDPDYAADLEALREALADYCADLPRGFGEFG